MLRSSFAQDAFIRLLPTVRHYVTKKNRQKKHQQMNVNNAAQVSQVYVGAYCSDDRQNMRLSYNRKPA